MLKPGDAAPAFTLASESDADVTLERYLGKKVVLYFYPRDDTSGCTTEACGFRDNWEAVTRAGAVVLGVSPDSVASHRKFKAKYDLPFTLLADPDHGVAEAYGVWGEKSMYGKKYHGIFRTTFVIDERGAILTVFERVKPKEHAGEVLAALKG
ncbi:MAG: thioredoxin-dependent thiol peroxidase [Gemmatimonadales bacterium]|nr:thioredoxin-dependent thiol peroxidase [Gemmatimonadales bacterium]